MLKGDQLLQSKDLFLRYLYECGAISSTSTVKKADLQAAIGLSDQDFESLYENLSNAGLVQGPTRFRVLSGDYIYQGKFEIWLTDEGLAQAAGKGHLRKEGSSVISSAVSTDKPGELVSTIDELASLRRQLAEQEKNLLLIQERKAEHVLETDVPLYLIKAEREKQTQIDKLKQCIEELEQNPQHESRNVGQLIVDPSKYYHIVSKLSDDKCLDVFAGQVASKTRIQLYQLHSGDNQQWRLIPVGNEYFYIVSKLSQAGTKCLDVPGGKITDGTPIELYSWHGGDNQQWKLLLAKDGYFHIVSKLSKRSAKCLDVPRSDIADETSIELYSLHGGENQQWKLFPLGE